MAVEDKEGYTEMFYRNVLQKCFTEKWEVFRNYNLDFVWSVCKCSDTAVSASFSISSAGKTELNAHIATVPLS